MGQALRKLSCGSAEPLDDPIRPPPSPPPAPSPPPFPLEILSYPHIFTSVISYCSPPTLSILLRCSKSTFEAVIPILYRELHFTQFRFGQLIEVKHPSWATRRAKEAQVPAAYSEYFQRALTHVQFLHLYEYKSDRFPIDPCDFPSLSIIYINHSRTQSYAGPALGLFKKDSQFVRPLCVSIRTTELDTPPPLYPLIMLSSEVERLIVDYCLHSHYAIRSIRRNMNWIPIIDSVIAIFLPNPDEEQIRSGTLVFGYNAASTMLGEEITRRGSLRLVGLDILGISEATVRERHFASHHPHIIFRAASILDDAVITSDTLPEWTEGRARKMSATIRADGDDSESEDEPSVLVLRPWELILSATTRESITKYKSYHLYQICGGGDYSELSSYSLPLLSPYDISMRNR